MSGPGGELTQHQGREYHVVVSGTLTFQVGFETYELEPGDSIVFDSTEPHMIVNRGEGPAYMYSWISGRRREGLHGHSIG